MNNFEKQFNQENRQEKQEKSRLTVEFGVEHSSILENRGSDLEPAWYYTIPLPTFRERDYFIASNITPEKRADQMPDQELLTSGLEISNMDEAKAAGAFIDASRTPLSDESADYLIYPNLFGDPAIPLSKKNQFPEEADRVLIGGGKVIIIEDAPQDASLGELIKFFSKTGLKLKDIFFETSEKLRRGIYPPYWAIFKKGAEDSQENEQELSGEVIEGLGLESIYQQIRDAGMTPSEIQKSFGGYRRLLQVSMHGAVAEALLKDKGWNTDAERNQFLSRINKAISFGMQEDDITRNHLEELKSMAEQMDWQSKANLIGLIEKYVAICRQLEEAEGERESTIKYLKERGFYDYESFRRHNVKDFLELK